MGESGNEGKLWDSYSLSCISSESTGFFKGGRSGNLFVSFLSQNIVVFLYDYLYRFIFIR